MALTDIGEKGNETFYDWYNAAINKNMGIGIMYDYLSTTSEDFGKGKTNTTTMISTWNKKLYGDQDKCNEQHKDVWGQIQTEAENGWFVPSRAEWSAFVGELGIITRENYNLRMDYWSSSQYSDSEVFVISFEANIISTATTDSVSRIRLSTTF